MNRTIKEATTKVFHYPDLESLKAHVLALVKAYNFSKHLKALQWKTAFEAICGAWTKDPAIFKLDPRHSSRDHTPKTTTVAGFTRKRPERDTFPEHLPRERVAIETPTARAYCGAARLRKLSEDVTRTLETMPRQWKVIQTVREKFSCREVGSIVTTPPRSYHFTPRFLSHLIPSHRRRWPAPLIGFLALAATLRRGLEAGQATASLDGV